MLLCWPDSEQVGFPQPVGWMIVKKTQRKNLRFFVEELNFVTLRAREFGLDLSLS